MLLPNKNTFLLFSLTWKKPTTPGGNTVYCPICTILIFEAIFLPSLMGSCPIGCFRWELAPLCPIRMNRRWVFLREASCLRFFSVLKLTIFSILSWKVWKRRYSWVILPFVYMQSSSHMQLCVNSVQDWVSKNGFKFSTRKTVCMHFCNQRKHFAEPSILLDKTPIKVVTEAKFLGVIFDRTLSYSSHVKYLKTNCLKTLDILKVVGQPDWGADQKTLCLYRALVRSKLDYGSIVYEAASNNILKKLDPIHHQGYELLLELFVQPQSQASRRKQKKCL